MPKMELGGDKTHTHTKSKRAFAQPSALTLIKRTVNYDSYLGIVMQLFSECVYAMKNQLWMLVSLTHRKLLHI